MFAALNPLISRPFHTRSSAASSALCKALRRTSAWSAACVLVVGLCVFQASPAQSADASPDSPDPLAKQRELYLQARQAQRNGHIADYLALRPQLSDYPLLPYLDYHDLSPQLAASAQRGSGYEAVDSFLSRHRGSWLGDRLERQWVDALAAEQRWDDLLRYYTPRNTTTTLRCQYLRARLDSGDTGALEQVADLWNVAVSQPNVCDPVFEAWMATGMPTADIAWSRFSKTLIAGHHNLARYVMTLLSEEDRQLAELWLRIDRSPSSLRNASLTADTSKARQVLLHGLRRLAANDAISAMAVMRDRNVLQALSAEEGVELQRFILMRMLLQDDIAQAEEILVSTPSLMSETLGGYLIRDALRQQDWPRVEEWLMRLPQESRDSERWQYWLARTLAREGSPEAVAQAQTIFESLSQLRSFYGFMAADIIGASYQMVDRPVAVDQTALNSLTDIPSVQRARELYLLGEEDDARSEWRYATARMTSEQVIASGKLADDWGWHRHSIQAMIQVGYWDDLALRFPLAWEDLLVGAATDLAIQPEFMFAIARQESAFMRDVRSPAGARGLMQLMPGTAQDMAREVGLQISNADLYRPEVNVILGGRYLQQLLEQFGGNRILAATAYNAGPNRVRQWLRDAPETALPLDVWIETIPYLETRGYVQNVLAYAVIYGYRRGSDVALLSEHEGAFIVRAE